MEFGEKIIKIGQLVQKLGRFLIDAKVKQKQNGPDFKEYVLGLIDIIFFITLTWCWQLNIS